MEREKRDLYDINSNLTNKTYIKGDNIPKGYYPMVVMIAIQNSKGEFLMQKRIVRKGGDWGVTGGHPKSGETPEQGIITEVKEELGIDISNEKIENFCSGCDGTDCYKMFYLQKDINISSLKIQEDELTEVKWFSFETLNQMVKTKELNKNQVEFFEKCINYLKNNKNTYDKDHSSSAEQFVEVYNEENLKDTEIDIVVTRLKAFIVNDKNEIYIASSGGGCQLPGGHLEENENLYNGLKREIQEETGIFVDDNEIKDEIYKIKYYTKNHKNTGKNRLSQIIYYIVKTNKSPDISKVKLTKNEIENKYTLKSIPISNFEDYVKNHMNESLSDINTSIIQELLKVFPYLIANLNK